MIITSCLRRNNMFAGAARATNTSSLRELSASGGQEARMHLLAGPPEDFTTNPLRLPSMQKDAPAPLALKMPRRYYSTPPRAQPQTEAKPRQKTTVLKLQKKYRTKKPITMLTCYDYPTATIVDEVGVDIVLVGDSSGMVVHGHDTTLPVSMEDIESHTRAVRRGAPNTFVIGDMPFGSFEVSPAEAVRNAVRLIKAGADAVKLEGGARMAETARAISNAGILVQGHIGLTPQTAAAMGGFRVQGKSCAAATELLEDAKALQEAGCFCIVIEGVPSEVAEYVTRNIEVMTIGIGAGKETSGQVLVLHDMMGLNPGRTPKFCKKYGDVTSVIKGAVQSYVDDVRAGTFPSPEYCYNMPEAESAKMKDILARSVTDASEHVYDRANACKLGTPSKKIAVIGGGAMGSFISGLLARQPGNTVCMVSDWSDHVNHITTNGLRLDDLKESGRGSSVISNIRATSDVSQILAEEGHMDLAIILVKSPNTVVAARKASQLVHPGYGAIMTLQNGMGNRERIMSVFDEPDRVIGGVTAHGAMLKGTGHVMHTGIGNTTLSIPDAAISCQERVQGLAEMLTLAGLDTAVTQSDSMASMVWGKLVINAGINPLTALFRVKNGVLAENAVCREYLEKTVREGADVAASMGVKLPFANPVETALQVARNTAMNNSSMLCDVLRGVETEIDAINGTVVREGTLRGVSVETNESLIAMVNGRQRLVMA